jgi:asparagine synthase (glutamine-hydrolysing)
MLEKLYKGAARTLSKLTAPPIVRAVRADRLSYLEHSALSDLFETVRTIERNRGGGILIEAGCALGGSAIVIASAKSTSRPLYVFDVFGMIPPPSEHDGTDVHDRYRVIKSGRSEGIQGSTYYGYVQDLLPRVTESFRRHGLPLQSNNVHLVQGLFQETLCINEPVALAHLDGDWYESVRTCLERIEPWLTSGGVLIVDDYDTWSGCRKAVDRYFSDKKDNYKFIRKSRLHIVRK